MYHPTQAPDGYHRKGICNQTVTFLGEFVACSDHLTYKDGKGVPQANELLWAASTLYPGKLKWLMGDFNLRPPPKPECADAVPWDFYVHYYEADQGSNGPTRDAPNQCAPPPGIKNDFIFGAKNAFTASLGGTPNPVTTSDHHYYVGEFTIPL